MEASLIVSRSWNPRAYGSQQLASSLWPSIRINSASTSFLGKQLRRHASHDFVSNQIKRLQVGVANAHSHSHPSPQPSPVSTPDTGVPHVPFLDDISHFFYKKITNVLSPYFPKEYDPLDWLPESIHHKLHNSEAAAILVLRELLRFGLFYFLFVRVDGFCKWLSWLYVTNIKHERGAADEVYKASFDRSSFSAMTDPMRLLIVVWALTRLMHVCAPLLRITLGAGSLAKIRSTAILVAVSWFFLRWKQLYVARLTTNYKVDAPRIVAFDKVVSLVMYFLAASCIGEVNGFALRSLLAVGGFSGVALGLAAKEIVSNFFGGALLFITRPFVIGERIKAGNTSGYVQDIGFLQTKILSTERVPMVVPNQSFINQVITNYSRAKNKLLEAEFPVRIQDILFVDRITNRVKQYLRSHPEVDPKKSTPVCYLKSVHQGGVEIAISCVIRQKGGSEFYRVKQAILMHVAEVIVSEGASLGGSGPFEPTIPLWAKLIASEQNSEVPDDVTPILE